MADNYTYDPIDSAGGQVRLLKIKFDIKHSYGYYNIKPLEGSLKKCYLPASTLPRSQRLSRAIQLPVFSALSYVWGDPARTHEISVDGKKIGITENLYRALRDLQRDAIGDMLVWADAICINQDDLAERSDQVFLMREIYHCASEVKIWLGISTEDGKRCMRFIANLTGGFGDIQDPSPEAAAGGSNPELDEKILKAVDKLLLRPAAVFVNAGIGFGQSLIQIADAYDPDGRDDKAIMLLNPDEDLSFHQETVEKLSKWRPSDKRLKKVAGEDFGVIAGLIDSTFIQQCAWFERMWVVQELGVAESGGIAYGGGVELWENFLKAVYYLHYTCNAPITNIRKLTGLEKIRMGWGNGLRQPLRELIRECRYRRATDPRDKIYALLGLMGDGMNNLLQPDYTKSVVEVYAHATQHFIIQSQSLDPICGWQTLGRDELPSWVPDYNMNQDLAASSLVPIDGRESLFAASGYDHQSKYILDSSSTLQWESLSVTGLCIDTIAMHSDPTLDDEFFGSIEQMWYSTVTAAGHILTGLSKDIEKSLEQISTIVGRYSDYWHTTGKSYLQSMRSISKENLSLEDSIKNHSLLSLEDLKLVPEFLDTYIPSAYLNSLVCGCQGTTERLSDTNARIIMSSRFSQAATNDPRDEAIGLICQAFEAGMRRRSIAVTSRGYIGAMPQEVQLGDVVCVLFGCSVPVVLRKRIDDESYTFIGECYLHGFMDAEAIAFQVKGDLKEQSFILS